MLSNNIQLSRECILSIEKFQVTMQDRESHIAFYERSQIPLCCDAMTTSLCKAMNSHIKEKMGCSSNTNTSKSLMFMAKGANQCIEAFEKMAHRELQTSSLCSKLVIKANVTRECLCWLPFPQNYITGNTPYGTGNATHTGKVIFKMYVTGTSAAKAGSPYLQMYFTGIAPKYNVQYR